MIQGDWRDLWKPNSVIIDKAGYLLLFPGEELRLGRELELNDKLVNIVGLVVTGQTFYLFILENLKQFGALKAIGVTNGKMLMMVLFQSMLVWFVGVGFGTALSATFFNISPFVIQLRHFILFWESAVGVAAFMLLVIGLASSAGLIRVIRLQPAEVFR